MTEGFECDKCKRFMNKDYFRHRIQKWHEMIYGHWVTELTFCSPCYKLVMEFIKTPINYEGSSIDEEIFKLRDKLK